MVDIREYVTDIVTPESLHDEGGSREDKIVNVYINEKHNVPVLELESGDTFWVWPGPNLRKLRHAYGNETDSWKGHTIKFELGTYHDKKEDVDKETVVLTPVSSRDEQTDQAKLPAPKDDLDDSIPF